MAILGFLDALKYNTFEYYVNLKYVVCKGAI